MSKWYCTLDKSHVFNMPTPDYYCPLKHEYPYDKDPHAGLLMEDEDRVSRELGLSVILMDASYSMTEVAFKGSPLTKMRLVADRAASGIFDLQNMSNNVDAIVCGYKFDNRVELMFRDSVANLILTYKKVDVFAEYIYAELFKMQEGTDINKALKVAYTFVSDFLAKKVRDFPVDDYEPMIQRILTHQNKSATIANIRVLIYTDGMQFDDNENTLLNPNPFSTGKLPDLDHDVVIGAFFGQENDKGCQELKSILSQCPIHDRTQFFLFDKPAKMGDLRYLFRMASGASGFCPLCLEQQLRR